MFSPSSTELARYVPPPFDWPYELPRQLSPRPFYDDLDPVGFPWALDPYSPLRCPLEPLHSCSNCALCSTIRAIPELPVFLSNLSYHDPYHHARISQLFEAMHNQFMLDYDDYDLSRELEQFSKALQRAYRRNSYCGRGLGDIANQLKYLGRDIMIGNPRRRRYGMGAYPRRIPRYFDDDDLYFHGGRRYGRRRW